jgi:hypothetical protein
VDIIDTITAKLNRAREHLESLDSAVREFYKSRPYTFSNEFQPKGKSLYDWVFNIHVHREIPLRISAIFGDGIQNVRATLDYLAYQLAVSNVGLGGDLDGTEFPIFKDEVKYRRLTNKGQPDRRSGLYKIRSIHPDAQRIIESMQPYHEGDSVLMWHLQHLSVIDKHRHFHIVSPPFGDWFAGTPLGEGLSPKPLKGLTIRTGILKRSFIDGAEVARFEVAVAPDFDFKVRVKHTIPGDIVLDEFGLSNAYAGHVLAGLIGFVHKKAIPQLSPFLK